MELLMVDGPTRNHRKCKQCWGHLSRGGKNEDTFKSEKPVTKAQVLPQPWCYTIISSCHLCLQRTESPLSSPLIHTLSMPIVTTTMFFTTSMNR